MRDEGHMRHEAFLLHQIQISTLFEQENCKINKVHRVFTQTILLLILL
jgi:hypothetical protein